jgi:membrane protein YdbS with pleckstrin-like domain
MFTNIKDPCKTCIVQSMCRTQCELLEKRNKNVVSFILFTHIFGFMFIAITINIIAWYITKDLVKNATLASMLGIMVGFILVIIFFLYDKLMRYIKDRIRNNSKEIDYSRWGV